MGASRGVNYQLKYYSNQQPTRPDGIIGNGHKLKVLKLTQFSGGGWNMDHFSNIASSYNLECGMSLNVQGYHSWPGESHLPRLYFSLLAN